MEKFAVERKTLEIRYTRHDLWPLSDYSICTSIFIFPVDLRRAACQSEKVGPHILSLRDGTKTFDIL